MIYKLGNVEDLANLSFVEPSIGEILFKYASILTTNYGSNRNVDCDDGGYVLYATPGTATEDVKEIFDYTDSLPEWIKQDGELCEALYLLNNEYVVVIVMSVDDAPAEIVEQMEEEQCCI